MNTEQIAEGLNLLNGLEHFSVNEMSVITAIKNGHNTPELIADETAIPQTAIENILTALSNQLFVTKTADGVYELKVQMNNPKLTFKGCLALPVTSFVDADGQRWVCRGKWYKIDESVNILEDIAWVEDMNDDEEMKSILKQISSTQQKRNTKAAKTALKDDAPATAEDLQYLKRWVNAGSNVKMWVYSVSANFAQVAFSPRFINPTSGNEFPFGIESGKVVIPIEEFRQRISGEYEKEHGEFQFEIDKVLNIDCKKNLFVGWESDEVAKFIEFKPARDGSIGAKHITVVAQTREVTKPSKSDVITQDQVLEYVKEHAPETFAILSK